MTIRHLSLTLISVFVALLIGTSLIVELWSNGAEDSGELINKAGKQRMFTQKMTKEAFLLANGVRDNSQMQGTIVAFEKGLSELKQSEKQSEGDSSALMEQYNKVSQLWTPFKTKLQGLSVDTDADTLLGISDESVKLLKASNAAVLMLEERSNADVALLKRAVIFFIVIGVVAGMIAMQTFKRILLTPLDSLDEVTNRIVRERDLRIRVNLQGDNELTRVAGSFNNLLESFETIYRQSSDIEHSIHEELERVSETMTRNKVSIDNQAGEIIQISTAATEMTHSVQEVARSTENASATADNTQQSAENGSSLLKQNMAAITKLAEEVNESFENIQELASASQEISGIAESINNIAEQTNLLALNAAIEAARAGEQGRGFAVVADEVRSLAQRTQEATGQIHSILTRFLEKSAVCVTAMENSKGQSDISMTHSGSLQSAFSEILESIEELNDLNRQVAVATQEQSSVSEDISRNITQIESKSHDIVAGAEETMGVVRVLQESAKKMRQELNTYRT